jgi:phage gp29-like protein
MLEKDARLFALFQSRKLGVLTVEHEIVPASEESADQEIADFVRKVIEGSKEWRSHLADLGKRVLALHLGSMVS